MRHFKILSLLILSLMVFKVNGQGLSGIATYQTSTKVDFNFDSTAVSPDQMIKMKRELQKKMQKEYDLVFQGSESLWKQKESLNSGPAKVSSNGMEVMMMSSDDNDVLYKNLKDKKYKRATELMGKNFLIQDDLPRYEWKLLEEYKKIGNYTCQKAIYQRISDAKTFSSVTGEMIETKDTTNVVGWFTAQIPSSHGPRNFHGLPGLILELSNGNFKVICTKIILNPEEKLSIDQPKEGRLVSKEEFDEINEEKMIEMMNRYRGGDGEIEIVIGG